jgi:mRNA interferase HicA
LNREKLLKILRESQCELKRHGARHDIYINKLNGLKAPVPRHNEIKESIVKMIKKQLGIQ